MLHYARQSLARIDRKLSNLLRTSSLVFTMLFSVEIKMECFCLWASAFNALICFLFLLLRVPAYGQLLSQHCRKDKRSNGVWG